MEVFEDVVFAKDWRIFDDAVQFKNGAWFAGDVHFLNEVEIDGRFYAPSCARPPTKIKLKVKDTWYEPKAFLSVQVGNAVCTVYDTNLLFVDCNLLPEVLPYNKAMPKLKEISKEAAELARFTKNTLLLRRKK